MNEPNEVCGKCRGHGCKKCRNLPPYNHEENAAMLDYVESKLGILPDDPWSASWKLFGTDFGKPRTTDEKDDL